MDREAAGGPSTTPSGGLPGWRVSRAEYHAEERRWQAVAHDGCSLGRRARHESLTGIGATEVEAPEDLRHVLEARGQR